MRIIGFIFVLIGVVAMVHGLTMDAATGASILDQDYGFGETNNLGLLNEKTNFMILGAALFVGGCVCVAAPNDVRVPTSADTETVL